MVYLLLFLQFAKVGLLGFGGGLAMLPMIYQTALTFGAMSKGEFSNLVTISQMTPGPLAVNAATYVGYNTAGVFGAVVATLGEATPSFILISLVVSLLTRFRESPLVEGAFKGIRPVTAGLIGASFVMVGESVFTSLNPIPIIICAATVFMVGKLKWSPITIMVIAGVAGAFLCR